MRLPNILPCLALLAAFIAAPALAEDAGHASATGQPDLAIRVLPRNDSCGEAEICRVVIHVLNQGDAPYDGPLSIFLDLHAPAVSEPPHADGPPCTREDYGKFRCTLDKVSLDPGGYALIEPEFLFTATAFESSNACAALEWTPKTLALRDRLLAGAAEASGHRLDDLARAAGLTPGEASRSKLLAALVGRWGEGDAVAADDIDCATIGIVTIRHEASCPAGNVSLNGICTPLAQWCPSNRQYLGGTDRCACPAMLPYWNSEAGKCEAQAAKLACAAAEADPAQACRCPADRPVLNAQKSACVTIESTVAAAPPPKPADPEAAKSPKESVPEAKIAEPEPQMAVEKPKPHVAAARPEPRVAAVKSEPRVAPRRERKSPPKRIRTASLEPKVKRSVQNSAAEAGAGKRRCRAFQVWGPRLNRCVPFAVFMIGRVFAPRSAAADCPAGLHWVNGRCRR
jgi:hypothetical protein